MTATAMGFREIVVQEILDRAKDPDPDVRMAVLRAWFPLADEIDDKRVLVKSGLHKIDIFGINWCRFFVQNF